MIRLFAREPLLYRRYSEYPVELDRVGLSPAGDHPWGPLVEI